MIYDVFPVFNEIDIIRARIEEWAVVPDVQHIALESPVTYQNDPKPMYITEASLDLPRLTVLQVNPVLSDDAWVTERGQRDVGYNAIAAYNPAPTDLVISTDVDEILRASKFNELYGMAVHYERIRMHFRYHFANRMWVDAGDWVVGSAFLWANAPPSFSSFRHIGPDRAVDCYDAGWHMSWWGGEDRFHTKLDAFAHTELDTQQWHDAGSQMIKDGFGFFDNKYLKYTGDPNDFPKGLPLTP